MSSLSSKLRQDMLTRLLAAKLEEYQLISSQLASETSPSTRLQLKRQAEETLLEIDAIDQELNQLSKASPTTPERLRYFHDHFYKINFRDATTILDRVFSANSSSIASAVFLIQRSRLMGGDWCVRRIREYLRGQTSQFRHIEITLPVYDPIDRIQILNLIRAKVRSNIASDQLSSYQVQLANHIAASVPNGGVLLFVIKNWDVLAPQDEYLQWFLEDFWTAIINHLSMLDTTVRRAKIVFVIMSDEVVITEHLSQSFLCSADAMTNGKIVEIPLAKWSVGDIRDWLDDYFMLDATQVDRVVELVYSQSERGNPVLVHKLLVERFVEVPD